MRQPLAQPDPAQQLFGACAGFLPHNFNPARVFMGDSGSMLLGLMLSAATVSLTGRVDPNAVKAADFLPALLPLLMPIAVLAVPLVDLLLAVMRRTRGGQAPWTSHRTNDVLFSAGADDGAQGMVCASTASTSNSRDCWPCPS